MPGGAGPKREREDQELKSRFKKQGRSKGRETQAAARIVHKHRQPDGETQGEKEKNRKGQSPDRGLPVPSYQHTTVSEVPSELPHLSRAQVRELERHERKQKSRKTLLQAFESAVQEQGV